MPEPKAAYGRKDLFGLRIPEGWESTVEGSMETKYRHGSLSRKLGPLIFYHKHEAEKAKQKWSKTMNSQRLPDDIVPTARPYLLTLPKQHLQMGTKCLDT